MLPTAKIKPAITKSGLQLCPRYENARTHTVTLAADLSETYLMQRTTKHHLRRSKCGVATMTAHEPRMGKCCQGTVVEVLRPNGPKVLLVQVEVQQKLGRQLGRVGEKSTD